MAIHSEEISALKEAGRREVLDAQNTENQAIAIASKANQQGLATGFQKGRESKATEVANGLVAGLREADSAEEPQQFGSQEAARTRAIAENAADAVLSGKMPAEELTSVMQEGGTRGEAAKMAMQIVLAELEREQLKTGQPGLPGQTQPQQ